jgi:hypothetical protein
MLVTLIQPITSPHNLMDPCQCSKDLYFTHQPSPSLNLVVATLAECLSPCPSTFIVAVALEHVKVVGYYFVSVATHKHNSNVKLFSIF